MRKKIQKIYDVRIPIKTKIYNLIQDLDKGLGVKKDLIEKELSDEEKLDLEDVLNELLTETIYQPKTNVYKIM